jgi:phage tail sheath gpL-like
VKTPFTGTRTISLTVGGFTATASYGSTATDATIAKALAAAANVEGSPVTAKVSGDTVTLTNKTAGTAGNISYTATDSSDFTISPGAGSLSGGANAITTTEYDAGTVNATVGSVTASAKWGKTSTSETLAKALAASLNSAGKGAFTATVSGSTVTITPASGMPAPSISVSVEDRMGFNPASFAASTGN